MLKTAPYPARLDLDRSVEQGVQTTDYGHLFDLVSDLLLRLPRLSIPAGSNIRCDTCPRSPRPALHGSGLASRVPASKQIYGEAPQPVPALIMLARDRPQSILLMLPRDAAKRRCQLLILRQTRSDPF